MWHTLPCHRTCSPLTRCPMMLCFSLCKRSLSGQESWAGQRLSCAALCVVPIASPQTHLHPTFSTVRLAPAPLPFRYRTPTQVSRQMAATCVLRPAQNPPGAASAIVLPRRRHPAARRPHLHSARSSHTPPGLISSRQHVTHRRHQQQRWVVAMATERLQRTMRLCEAVTCQRRRRPSRRL